MILSLALDLPEDGAFLHMTRAVGRAALESLRVQPTVIDDTETVVAELYSNVLRHAQSEKGRFSIILEYFADKLVVMVEDKGGGFSFSDLPPAGSLRPDLDGSERIGGFGLPLVEALSDKLEFHRHDSAGMRIRAEKRMVYETPADAQHAEAMNNSHVDMRLEAGLPGSD